MELDVDFDQQTDETFIISSVAYCLLRLEH